MNPRLLFIVALAASWFVALGCRLYQLQVTRHVHYSERARQQQNRMVTLTPPRGTIYDRHGRELAISVEVQSIAVDPTRVENKEEVVKALARILRLDKRQLAKKLESNGEFVWVKRKVEPARAKRIKDLGLRGVILLPENKRYYPFRELAAAVLGYVGTDNAGLAGLEFLYDPVVASAPGKRTVVRDARSGIVLYPSREVSAARPGQDLYLTLDATIQHFAEEELQKAIHAANAKKGMAVVLDAESSAVLAMASYPTFDPNKYNAVDAENWRNQPVADAFEPGSTFKMVTLAAALEAGVISPRDVFNCEMGAIRMHGVTIRDHKPFGMLNVADIMAHSSNIGTIKLGRAAGRQRLHATIEAFGFGRPTGVDLPSESPGLLRPLERWSSVSPAYISFGQGISVTGLQLTTAFGAIANGGRLMKPYVVASVGRPGEEGSQTRQPEVKELPISPSSVAQIRSMLGGVVEYGTAKSAEIPGFGAAGKTGTAEKAVPGRGYVPNRYVASFVGFAPYKDPKIVVLVALDEPWPAYHGGDHPAPAFQAIAEKTLLYLGIRPKRDAPMVWPGEDNRVPRVELASLERTPQRPERQKPQPVEAGKIPDFAGLSLRQAIALSSQLGLRLAPDGNGLVERQEPAPGVPLETAGGTVRLWLTSAHVARSVEKGGKT